ncbi:DCL family protein [Streptomyces sp. NPDC058642]|uniref:DCL family protein n=1 Tax=Streptomyces sp. NPDC058642 TaxID=3346572 RepID=UPI00365CC745
MSPRIPVWIGHRPYPSIKDAKDACRDLVAKHPGNGQAVGQVKAQGSPQLVDDQDDIAFLHDLLKSHPCPGGVIGAGVKHFLVSVNADGHRNQRCLWVWRDDDSADDFSWKDCVDNAPREAT